MFGQLLRLLNVASRPGAPLAPPAGRGWPRRKAGSGEGPCDGSGWGATPHPPFGHLFPASGEKAKRPACVWRGHPSRTRRADRARPSPRLRGEGGPAGRRGRVRGLAMVRDGAPPLIRPSGTFSPRAGRRRNGLPVCGGGIRLERGEPTVRAPRPACGERVASPQAGSGERPRGLRGQAPNHSGRACAGGMGRSSGASSFTRWTPMAEIQTASPWSVSRTMWAGGAPNW